MMLRFRDALVLALALVATAAHARTEGVSHFGLPPREGLGAPAPRLAPAKGLLAQRVIDREWGPSDDSTYREVNVPGWKSEGLSLALSGVLPGSGQLYNGENSGWLFVATEFAGWAERWASQRSADRKLDDLAGYLGDPNDPNANFSFERLRANSAVSTTDLERLWAGDRDAYYRALRDDPRYLAGFGGSRPANTFSSYDDLLSQHDSALRRVTLMELALMLNHLGSAIDAFRAARFHNLPLRQQYQLQLGQRWRRGHPELRAALVRRF